MDPATTLALFFIGFYILIKGAGILIHGSASIARIFNVSTWFIGMMIIGFGTSLPELSISIASALNGNNIGLGTIIGGNIFKVLAILGIAAIFIPIYFKKQWVEKDLVVHIGAMLITGLIITLPVFGNEHFNGITRDEGIFLFALFLIWAWFLFHRKISEEEALDYKVFTLVTSIIMIIAGLAGVFVGGQWVVRGAVFLAELFNASPALIGLSVIAVGTSLPELTVTLTALFKRSTAIAVGGIIGSNIINFLGIIGLSAAIRPIPVFSTIQYDMFIMLGVAIVLFVAMFSGKRYVLARWEGLLFVLGYAAYLTFIIMRG